MEKVVRFNSIIQDVRKVNPLFSRAKAYVLYAGQNRNNSYIDKDAVNKSLHTIYNIPIVGEFLEHKDNFGGHGGKLEITDEKIEWKMTTMPYGVIPESAEIYWENVTEKDGTINEYLVVDGIYLWSSRFEELNMLKEEKYNQSMEIEIENGHFAIINGRETFKIDEFTFSALCILGIDKDGEGHVEPCFESSSIVAYSLDKDEFKKQFTQMIAELKFSLQDQEGGNKVEEKLEFNETVEVEEEITETVTEEVDNTDTEEVFETVEDVVEETEIVEVVEETETVEETTEEVEEIDYQSKFEELEKEFTKLKENFSNLETEIVDLREFKSTKLAEERNQAENDLFERFTAELTEEEIAQVKEKSSEFTLEQLEEKLFTLVGKKKATFSKQVKKEKQSIKIELDFEQKDTNPYGNLFDNIGK